MIELQLVNNEFPKLSICIATYNRGRFIGETLDSILGQMEPGVELVVVDGASPDSTPEVMVQYMARYPEIRYYREQENSGIDRDYDKAVGYARGEYCWLMTDDDLMHSGAIFRVLESLNDNHELVVVNSEVRNVDFSTVLEEGFLKFTDDRVYSSVAGEKFFSEVANYLSFIGGVVIKRSLWQERDRSSYYGTLFIHVGVIFQQPPIVRAKVIAEPLIMIRYGNAMWTPRGFEIWMFKWPELIWSFTDFSNEAKISVCPREPWRRGRLLFFYRAIGGYTITEYRRLLAAGANGMSRAVFFGIAVFPATIANFIAGLYCVFVNRKARTALDSISRSQHASWMSRILAKFL
ncbi:glycosyltransferase family 2 protein [Sulfuriferula thiophila]|uniref:glycosyltransferase family 2 protein n=1 Tax=Sulfuriferula thiophila TaxID=1781211 RepID=UPI000F608AC3|nr:glycosyltransferase family 2 protein [Sulfuriferula thiophila]